MKRATVSVRLQDRFGEPDGRQEISGYACEIDGIQLVVHRSITHDMLTGQRVPSATQWTVTEPKTGRSIWDGSHAWDAPDKQTRSYAIHRAECVIAEQRGRVAVEQAIAERVRAEGER